MKLKRFTKNKKQKRIVIGSIVGILLLIGGITLYRTFALYKVEASFDVLKGTVPDFSSGDVTLAFTVNGTKESGVPFPNKNEGFKVDGVTCDNNEQASWDDTNWALKIENSNGNSKIKCTIKFKRYEEEILKGAYPVLKDGLVPVTIDETTGNVTKADITTNWYEYGKQKWANAVILTEEGKKKNITEGSTIDENDIESYFVWIPKYKYKLFDMGNYENVSEELDTDKQNKAIEIKFGTDNTTDTDESCKTPGISGESGSCLKDKWMTHPAFLAFGGNGFWVGKFESGYKCADSKTAAEQNNDSSEHIVIKPDQFSWRNITIGNSYTASLNYKKELLSHNMKNTEWGAVAYLTQSIYGRCKDGTCTEVSQNKNSSYMTGMKDASTAYPKSQDASTTGNNSGIFDMNGGAWEKMASVMASNGSSTPLWSNSGLQSIDDERYYDLYNYYTDQTRWNRRILGDATGELGPFQYSVNNYISSYFGDYAGFVHSGGPWFYRGGHNGTGTGIGIFAFSRNDGDALATHGFRIVLAPV